MIQETTKKINFSPYHASKGAPRDTSSPPTCRVNTKVHTLTFNKPVMQELGMANRFIRMFYEPNRNIIGWQITDKVVDQAQLKLWKLCKPHKDTGIYVMSIKRMLSEMKLKPNHSYRDLEVKKYRELGLSGNEDRVYYYIEVQDNKINIDDL